MKSIVSVVFIIFMLIIGAFSKNETQYLRLKRLKCEINPEFVYDNVTCFAKAFNRTSTGVNLSIHLKKPMGFLVIFFDRKNKYKFKEFSFQFEMICYYRYGTIFRQVLKLPRIDHCWVASVAKHNPMIATVTDILKKLEPTLIHDCPYTSLIIENKPVRLESLPAIFAAGDYKFTIQLLTRKKEESIFVVEALATWYSSERNSFG